MTTGIIAVKDGITVVEKTPTNMFEVVARAAADPKLDAEKLMKLLDMQEHIMAKQAEIDFNSALARLDLPRIVRKGSVAYSDKSGVSKEAFKFARWEDIDKVIRPLLSAEGFTLSFNSDARDGGGAVITGTLSHVGGHSRKASLPLALDNSGGKNNIQGMGSTISYGKRYTATMLLNIVTVGEDDDGGGDDEVITNEQAVEIDLLVVEVKADRERFLKWIGAFEVQNIKAKDYEKAVSKLNEKKVKK